MNRHIYCRKHFKHKMTKPLYFTPSCLGVIETFLVQTTFCHFHVIIDINYLTPLIFILILISSLAVMLITYVLSATTSYRDKQYFLTFLPRETSKIFKSWRVLGGVCLVTDNWTNTDDSRLVGSQTWVWILV